MSDSTIGWILVVILLCLCAWASIALAEVPNVWITLESHTTPDGRYRIELGGINPQPAQWEVYSTLLPAGVRTKISHSMPHHFGNGYDADFGLIVSRDSRYVVYRAGSSVPGANPDVDYRLYSARVDGPGSGMKIGADAKGRVLGGLALVPGDVVRFSTEDDGRCGCTGGTYYVWASGGNTLANAIFLDGFEGGNSGAWR